MTTGLSGKKINTLPDGAEPWYGAYEVPEVAYGIMDLIVTEQEQRLIASFIGGTFSAADAQAELGIGSVDETMELLSSAYRRGVISIAEGIPLSDRFPHGARGTQAAQGNESAALYRIGNFFTRLDIVSTVERDIYFSIPVGTRDTLESLYFERYYSGLDWSKDGGRPTRDAIITFDETIALLEAKAAEGRNIYRMNCDCRSLKNGCGHLKDVCITFEDGTNTWAARGIAERLSLDEAKDVIRAADRDGLIHSSNPHGICNCCADCCYLLRSRKRRDSGRVWPASIRIASVNADACIGCGLCVKRCPLGALSVIEKKAVRDGEMCIGCGLCISSCNFGALSLRSA